MIDGLKLTFSGEELRKVLDQRIASHLRGAERWRRELSRTKDDETEVEEQRRPLRRISGGAFKGKHGKGQPSCPFCGGTVELQPFTVPAAEVDKVGNRWLWSGQSAGPPEGRRYAR